MSGPTINGVSRELLASFAAYVADSPNAVMRSRAAELRALLDSPESTPCAKSQVEPAAKPAGMAPALTGEAMTTKQTLDGVHRDTLDRALNGCGLEKTEALKELRALMDAPTEQFNPNGWSIDHSAGRPILMHNSCSVIEAEQAYGLLELIKTAAQPQGDGVNWKGVADQQKGIIEQQQTLIASLRAELVESYRIDGKPHGEPVAWMNFDGEGGYEFTEDKETADLWKVSNGTYTDWLIPLYAEQFTPDSALKAFANEMINAAFEGGSFDGGDIEDIAVKHGLLRIERREEECGEVCACRSEGDGFPAECYRKTALLRGEQPAPVAFDFELAAQKLASCMDYPWEHMPEQGRAEMREHAKAIISAAVPVAVVRR